MLIDARSIEQDSAFACDLCIVGAGPAGITVAERLRESGLSILLLESGGLHPELATQALYRGAISGQNYFRLDACRFRLFGGSSNRWGGWCRPLEPVDYERRDWLPWSGWPIDEKSIEPYYAEAARMFDLTDARFDLDSWRTRLPTPFPLDGTNFESIFFQYSPETNFGTKFGSRLAQAPNVTTILHANVTAIELDPGTSRVGILRGTSLSRRVFTVHPKAVVLAAGGIENARLLLNSRDDRTMGLGNEFDLVGRFFMEHLHVPVGHMLVAPGATGRKFYRKTSYAGATVRGVVTPTASAQERHHLLATSIAIEPAAYAYGTPFIGWPPPVTFGPINLYRALREGRLERAASTVKKVAEKAWGMPLRARTWLASRQARAHDRSGAVSGRVYSLYFRSEQAPDRGNRVELTRRKDALGMPEIGLNWRANSVDLASIAGWLEIFDRDVRARGLGRVIRPQAGWERRVIGGPHHMGTTRMSADPRHGVVDADCRVHSVENLYIAGSSVFATSGYANPTFTIVSLALRLADTLSVRLREGYVVSSSP